MEDCDIERIPATSEESKSITSISQENVHRICSGQVILSLAVAVKELVENSIDAGATSVEIKLVDHGLDYIEVSDNGSGVEEHNLDGMTAKYHTSKLREFVDLQSVATFGFRGEALSSLCALAKMSITTRHKNSDVAVRIEMDHEGKIISRHPCARTVGTTVTLSNIFEKLPVRRRAFVKNVKKEFNSMCQILQAYCLVCTGVRIKCTNQTPKGNKTVVVQSHGSLDVLSNISAIFGTRQSNDILEIKSPLSDSRGDMKTVDVLMGELQDDLGDANSLDEDDVKQILGSKLEGYISSCSHGCGRSSKDRQYFYVNFRPCDPKNISKVVNEYYHRYNAHQFPFVYLNIITNRESVDVNLTPDKRVLNLNNEKVLLALIKKALIATFDSIPSTYKVQNTTITSILTKQEAVAESELGQSQSENLEASSQRFYEVLSQWKSTGDTEGAKPLTKLVKRKCPDEIESRKLKMQKIQEYLNREQSQQVLNETTSCKSESEDEGTKEQDMKYSPKSLTEQHDTLEIATFESLTSHVPTKESEKITAAKDASPCEFEGDTNCQKTVELDESDSEQDFPKFTCNELKTSISEIETMLQDEIKIKRDKQQKSKLQRLRFKSEINPNQNKTAEAELQKEINKSHFVHMEILGQFNLGFIITKLDADLFIVDQHATDEKYNFEILQQTTTLQHQPLTIPQTLELTAVNEMVLIDHLPVFEKNGFKFEINDKAPPTRKIRLLGKPFSKNWEFGKEDIDELIFMLQDAPEDSMCRPSRIRAMFASRACRKSVMIGQALKKSTMEMLVKHMGEIEQPWNCPHGRPTMRHLINYAMLSNDDIDDCSVEQSD
uniref:MutL C-terminal dimerisation domain-containing protein n=1 Tax=Stomoxys calcitrans TaxID=35570 RepID=A0A1I8PFE9_STOCA